MACSTSLLALPKACGELVTPGVSKVYAIAFADLQPAANGSVYTSATNGMISTIDVATGKSFVEIGINPSSAGITEAMTKNTSAGIAYLTQTFTINFAGLSTENRSWVESVMNQDVVFIVRDKSKTPKYFAVGLDGLFTLTGLEGGTGVGQDDTKGYQLTFTGVTSSLVPQVDETIISGLLTPAV